MTPDPRPLRLVDTPPVEGAEELRASVVESMQTDADASKALEHVVGQFDAFIRRSARRHGLDRAEVDEVVQDLRVRMWKSLGTADLIRRAKASYIYRAAISASIDIIRRRRARRFEATSLDDGIAEAVSDPRRRADSGVEGDELAATVHRAVGMLSESRRAVVRMHLAGYERDEIADLLGWTEAKTRNLLYRGLADLRDILDSWGMRPSGAMRKERERGTPQ
jgi:RNA polymerase sigma factor (sigma-70 family)